MKVIRQNLPGSCQTIEVAGWVPTIFQVMLQNFLEGWKSLHTILPHEAVCRWLWATWGSLGGKQIGPEGLSSSSSHDGSCWAGLYMSWSPISWLPCGMEVTVCTFGLRGGGQAAVGLLVLAGCGPNRPFRKHSSVNLPQLPMTPISICMRLGSQEWSPINLKFKTK